VVLVVSHIPVAAQDQLHQSVEPLVHRDDADKRGGVRTRAHGAAQQVAGAEVDAKAVRIFLAQVRARLVPGEQVGVPGIRFTVFGNF